MSISHNYKVNEVFTNSSFFITAEVSGALEGRKNDDYKELTIPAGKTYENKVQELHKPSTEEGSMSIKDDAIVQAFGPERRGSVRGLGFGALPSKVDAQAYQNQNMRQLNEKLLLLEQELREMKAEMLKGKRQNEEPSKGANGHSHEETQDEENGRGEHRVHGGGECRMHSQQNIWVNFVWHY
ncbi:hypothetical protein LOK49_LG08G00873 [Camellia lanceoleosa]|uniref:Uncharacterized protein n=1 Tax=Camellia lanceoleosa TaxID=1840588 RepID=A0ACC0GTC7_9ERIC|nr:hypothetical protein LOK49_LG08G00873 [Camellia lanceoleosa]